ncbi:LysR family transcriptional regulator [Candidimonas humi]|uniref:LysR family transcriptional regulator n=1 Tax=Candidimonas humi TaxID=683355 RepID=A0ABV8NT87_9BURK
MDAATYRRASAPRDSKLDVTTIEPNLRRLRTFIGVARWGSVRKAAQEMHLTQPAVTRAVQKLESELGVSLFQRTARGMCATSFGTVALKRATRALEHLERAQSELGDHLRREETGQENSWHTTRHLVHALTHRHLQALIATAESGTQAAAAAFLGISQPAVAQALNDLEKQAGAPLLLRAGSGMIATTAGEVLLRHGKLALAEIAAMPNDIAESTGVIMGRVRIGVLPLSGTLLVPRAVSRLIEEHHSLQICLVDGSYDTLLRQLRYGDIDVIVGPLRAPCPAGDIIQERLFDSTLSVIARKGHPLEKRKALTLAELGQWGWVLPRRGTPAYLLIERILSNAGLAMPSNPIESNGLAAIRALLVESNRLSMISRHQVYFEERDGLLCILPVELYETGRPVGIASRAGAVHSAGVLALLKHLRAVGSGDALVAGKSRRGDNTGHTPAAGRSAREQGTLPRSLENQ